MRIPVNKGRTVTANFYKNDVLRNWRSTTKYIAPKQDLSTSDSCKIMHKLTSHALWPKMLESEKVVIQPHSPFSQTWPLRLFFFFFFFFFLFPKFKESTIREKKTWIRGLSVSDWCPLWRLQSENWFQKRIHWLKWCFQVYGKWFLSCYSMNYRDFSVKSKLIISLFQTVKLSP